MTRPTDRLPPAIAGALAGGPAGGVYPVYDDRLYDMNFRQNAQVRVHAWLAQQHGARP